MLYQSLNLRPHGGYHPRLSLGTNSNIVLSGMPFASNGATMPNYTLFASAKYYAPTDTTWLSWEAWDTNAVVRVPSVRTFNHTTRDWSDIYPIGVNSLHNDDHGNPGLTVHGGYGHSLYGAHVTGMSYSVTTNVNDPSAWTLVTNNFRYGSIGLTYPRFVSFGTDLYLFVRANLNLCVVFKATTFTGGAANWNGGLSIIDFAAAGRIYTSQPRIHNGKFYFVACSANTPNTSHADVFYFVYDPVTGSLANIDSSTVTAAGSLPINLATAQASYRIVTTGDQPQTEIPDLCFDEAGNPNIFYCAGDASPFHFFHNIYIGGSLSAPHQIGIAVGIACGLCISPSANGGVTCYWAQNEGPAFSFQGGWLYGATRSSSGIWTDEAEIQCISPDGKALNEPKEIVDGRPELRVTWTECVQSTRDDEAGGLKMWGYGDNGYLDGPS